MGDVTAEPLAALERPPRQSSLRATKPLPRPPPSAAAPSRSASARRVVAGVYQLPVASHSAPHLTSDVHGPAHDADPTPLAARPSPSDKRFLALSELIATERAYLEDLCILTEIYFTSLANTALATVADCARIDRNAGHIVSLHRRICEAISDIESHWRTNGQGDCFDDEPLLGAIEGVCRIFSHEAPNFSTYALYDAATCLANCAAAHEYEQSCAAAVAGRIGRTSRLKLADFCIKPIQRICRYPLLLRLLASQLEPATAAHIAALDALAAMTAAASAVDVARRARDAQHRTLVVASRMEMPSSVQPAFLSFLGQLELVGALHVLQLPSGAPGDVGVAPLRAKYLGTLLYRVRKVAADLATDTDDDPARQSHLVLVKVRSSDNLAPRHWLPLRAVDVHRLEPGASVLPHALLLTCASHRFELGCQTTAEQHLWSTAIAEGRARATTAWLSRVAENPVDPPFDETSVSSVPLPAHPASTMDQTAECPEPLPGPAALRARFPSVLGRTTSSARAAVDSRLADVMSTSCLMSRYQPRAQATSPSVRRKPLRTRSTPPGQFLPDMHVRFPAPKDQDGVPKVVRHLPSTSAVAESATLAPGSAPPYAEPPPTSLRTFATASRALQGAWRRRRTTSARDPRDVLSAPPVEGDADCSHHLLDAPVASPSSLAPDLGRASASSELVRRQGSASSSSGSSGPPSPALATPADSVERDISKWFSLSSRGGRSATSLARPASAPDADQRALDAADFLRGAPLVGSSGWREALRTRGFGRET